MQASTESTQNSNETNNFQCCMCLETYNKQKKNIHCTKCNSYSCTACFRSYICHCRNDPPCPGTSCNYVFQISELRDKLPQTFWNGEYKTSRKDVLFNFEEVYKSGTMVEVQKTQDIRAIDAKIENAVANYHLLKRKVREAKLEMDRLSDDKHYTMYHSYINREGGQQKIQLKVPCHVDSCMGFCIENKCPVCSAKTCSKCHRELTDNHECNSNDVETVQEIAKHTKPCPTCNTAISKVDGCDQMLCITCETAFSWRTGKIETGRIHNPHLYQIRGRIGRELGDELCGGLPTWRNLAFVLNYDQVYRTSFVSQTQQSLMIFHRFINHIRAVVFPKFENLTLNFATNLKSRVLFYLKEITKEKYTQNLFKTEKCRIKNMEMRDLFQTFVTVAEEIFRKIYSTKTEAHISELYGLYDYLSENYHKINSKYKSAYRMENFVGMVKDDLWTLDRNCENYRQQISTA